MRLRLMALCTIAGLAVVAAPTRAETVTATAYSYEVGDSQTHPTSASALIHRQGLGAPGSSEASAGARHGALGGLCNVVGCGFEFNNFQQPCNDARTDASFNDQITILANAPNGTAIQVRATLTLTGTIHGIGGYSYSAGGWVNAWSDGFGGSTGGGVVTLNNQMIDDTRVGVTTLYVGSTYNVSGILQTQVYNRYCAGGGDCTPSESEWEINFTSHLTLRLEVLTPDLDVQVVAQSGHDYLAPVAAVPAHRAPTASLSPAWPNPARGPVSITLALDMPSPVDVAVFDVAGRRVATLAKETLPAGSKSLSWDGRDTQGRAVNGLFFIRAKGPQLDATRRVMLLR